MSSTSVSVIIPVYNRASLIGDTLRSILAQTHRPDEVIVVDDGSTDNSAEVAQSIDPHIKVIRSDNRGPARARNLGLAEASGDYVQFMDSDDLATPRYLEARLNQAQNGRADMVYGAWLPAEIRNGTIFADRFVRQTRATPDPLNAYLKGWVLFLPNTLIKRSLINDAGGYPEEFVTGEDMLLLYRLLLLAKVITHTPDSVLIVRQHPEHQISASSKYSYQRALDELELTQTIAMSLADGYQQSNVSQSAIRAWSRRCEKAHARLSQNGQQRPKMLNVQIRSVAARLSNRFRSLIKGHDLDPIFQVAPISQDQTREIESLGYILAR